LEAYRTEADDAGMMGKTEGNFITETSRQREVVQVNYPLVNIQKAMENGYL
jgi:hypothetical protein